MTSVNTSREDIDDDVRRERQEVVRLEDEVRVFSCRSLTLF